MRASQRAGRAAAAVVAVVVLLHPPWTARAVRVNERYGDDGSAPLVVADSARWPVRWARLYAPPRMPLGADAMRALGVRSSAGDTASRRQLRETLGPFEARYGVPELLRADGAIWRDSVLASAGIRSATWYDVRFTIDSVALALRLVVIAATVLVLDWHSRRDATPGRDRPARR